MSTALRLTPDEYDQMIATGAFDAIDRKIELFRGELREMSPAGPIHSDYIDFLTRWSTDCTTGKECAVRVQSQIDLDHSRPEPDLTWLKPGRYRSRHPSSEDVLLLIEVADSSASFDMREKARLYAEFRITEYWVVDIAGRCIHVHTDSNGHHYESVRRVQVGDALAPKSKPEAALDLNALFSDA